MPVTFYVPFDEHSYTPTDEDRIWLATALYGETRGNHSREEWERILWTWTNRALLHSSRPWDSIADLVANHSQPVNPYWREGGKYCKPGSKYWETDHCAPSRLRWRAKMAAIIKNQSWEAIPQGIIDVVDDFIEGRVPDPMSDDGTPLVDFASNKVAQNHGTQYESGGNWFLSREQVQNTSLIKSFIIDRVRVIGPDGTVIDPGTATSGDAPGAGTGTGGAGLLWFLIGGAIAWWIHRN